MLYASLAATSSSRQGRGAGVQVVVAGSQKGMLLLLRLTLR